MTPTLLTIPETPDPETLAAYQTVVAEQKARGIPLVTSTTQTGKAASRVRS